MVYTMEQIKRIVVPIAAAYIIKSMHLLTLMRVA